MICDFLFHIIIEEMPEYQRSWQLLPRHFSLKIIVNIILSVFFKKIDSFFFLYIFDIKFTKENKIYNHQVHWKYMYLGEKVKVKKKIKNAINNIKKVLKS